MRFCLLTLLAFFLAFTSACSTKKKKNSGDAAPASGDLINPEDEVSEDDGEDRIKKVDDKDDKDDKDTDDKDDKPGIKLGGGIGCVQGKVINGETGEPIDKAEVYVHVAGQIVKGEEQSDIEGEYYLCGVPVDESFPIFAKKAGHQEFQGYISVSSSVASATAQADKDIAKPKPTAIGNIRMYGLEGNAPDFTINVSFLGASLTGAKVRLKSLGTNIFDVINEDAEARTSFLVPESVYYESVEIETDAVGNAVFEKAGLVFGGRYSYIVIPPAASGASVGRGLATIGDIENNQTSANSSRIGLVGGDAAVAAISTNALTAGIGALGPVRIAFSHQIQAPADIAPVAIATLTTEGFPVEVTQVGFTFTTTDDDFVLVATPAYLDANDAAVALTAAANPDAGFAMPVDIVQAKAVAQGSISLIGTVDAPGLFFGKTIKLFD